MSADAAFLLLGFAVFLAGTAVLVRWNVTELARLGLGRRLLLLALIAPTVFSFALELRSLWSPALATTLLCTGVAARASGRPVQALWRYLVSAAGVAACAAFPGFELASAMRATEMGKLGVILVPPLTAGLVLGAVLGARRRKASAEENAPRAPPRGLLAAVAVLLLLIVGGAFWPVVAGVVLWLRDGPARGTAPVASAPAPARPPDAAPPVAAPPLAVPAATVRPVAVQPSSPPPLAEDLFPLAVGFRWSFVTTAPSPFGSGRLTHSWDLEVTGTERTVIDGSEVEVFRIEVPPSSRQEVGSTDDSLVLARVDATQVRLYSKADAPARIASNSPPQLTPEGLILLRSYPRRRPPDGTWPLVPLEGRFDVIDGSRVLGSRANLPFDAAGAVALSRSGCNPRTCDSFTVVLVPGVGRVYESQASSGEPHLSRSFEKTMQRFFDGRR